MSAGFKFDPDKVEREFQRLIGKGLRGAARFAANRAKELVSVPAPRARDANGNLVAGWQKYTMVKGKSGKLKKQKTGYIPSYATPGAPPRKLSGTLRSRITSEVISDTQARVGLRLVYGAVHEYGSHPFLSVMIEQNKDALARLIASGG